MAYRPNHDKKNKYKFFQTKLFSFLTTQFKIMLQTLLNKLATTPLVHHMNCMNTIHNIYYQRTDQLLLYKPT